MQCGTVLAIDLRGLTLEDGLLQAPGHHHVLRLKLLVLLLGVICPGLICGLMHCYWTSGQMRQKSEASDTKCWNCAARL